MLAGSPKKVILLNLLHIIIFHIDVVLHYAGPSFSSPCAMTLVGNNMNVNLKVLPVKVKHSMFILKNNFLQIGG